MGWGGGCRSEALHTSLRRARETIKARRSKDEASLFGEAAAQSDLLARFLKGDRQDMRCDSCALNYAGVDRCVSHAFGIEEGGVQES